MSDLLCRALPDRDRERSRPNPRMRQIYAARGRMDEGERGAVLSQAEAFLDPMDRDALV